MMGLVFVSLPRSGKEENVGVQRLCLALLFLLGAALGYGYALLCAAESAPALSAYLADCFRLYEQSGSVPVSFGAALRLYFGHTLVIFLLSFAPLGIIAIPAVVASCGFSAMFAVACFLQLFGRAGIFPALAALGLRLVVTLPCMLWLGACGWAAASGGRGGKRVSAVKRSGRYWLRFCVCVIILALGVMMECTLVPKLFFRALSALCSG